MTTIVYKDGVVAYDSRATDSSMITTDNFNKKISREGIVFFACGAVADMDEIVDLYLHEGNRAETELHFEYLIVDNGKVYSWLGDGSCVYLEEITKFGYYALGSGASYATTAMDLGCTAKEAVKMAAKRDFRTGGRIRTYEVK